MSKKSKRRNSTGSGFRTLQGPAPLRETPLPMVAECGMQGFVFRQLTKAGKDFFISQMQERPGIRFCPFSGWWASLDSMRCAFCAFAASSREEAEEIERRLATGKAKAQKKPPLVGPRGERKQTTTEQRNYFVGQTIPTGGTSVKQNYSPKEANK